MDSDNFSFCAVCSKHFTGRDNYFQHMISHKHKRKVAVSQRLGLTGFTSNNLNKSISTVHMEVKQELPGVTLQNGFFCDICNVPMSGPESYDAHMIGAPHAKRVKNLELQKSFGVNNLEQQKPLDSRLLVTDHKLGSSFCNLEEPTSSTSNSGPSNFNLQFEVKKQDTYISIPKGFHCEICETTMTGPESYRSHMVGAPHAKKVRNLDFKKNIGTVTVEAIEKATANLNLNGAVSTNFFCDECQVQISGITNFDQHLKGANHHKKIQQKVDREKFQRISSSASLKSDAPVALSNLSNFKSNYDPPLIPVAACNIFCYVCNVSVCGQENYNQHLKGALHRKKEMANTNFQVPVGSFNFDGSNHSEEREEVEKNIEELKDKIPDVLFCNPDQDPKELILGKW